MPPLPESNKRPGVHYAFTTDGIELPIVDVSHPAFALNISAAEQERLVQKFLQQKMPFSFLPSVIQKEILKFFLRGSALGGGIQESSGTFMTGMNTYLLKLGPEMLGSYAKPIDRRIAAALPCLGVRLRLQDMSYLQRDLLVPVLSANSRQPLYLINIAGGPAIDSLNALILLSQAGVLEDRAINILVLDQDDSGPAFGRSALIELTKAGGPLQGLRIEFRHLHYDWSQTKDLAPVLESLKSYDAISICSSEGGLFEYGSDDDIVANLRALRSSTHVLGVVGSVTRNDDVAKRLSRLGSAALHCRGLEAFRVLAESAGWKIERLVERPFSDQIVLV